MLHSLRVRLLLAIILVVLIAISVTAIVARQRTTGEFRTLLYCQPGLERRPGRSGPSGAVHR